jgi:Uma2 family endonuclease
MPPQPTPKGSVSPRAEPRVPIAKQRNNAQKALAEVRNRHKRAKASMDLPIELLREEMAQRRLEIKEAEDLVASLSK